MADGAIPRNVINDPASGVIALDINVTHLWARHKELKADLHKHAEDDVLFRAEVWKRVGHLENLKWWVLGAAAAVSATFAYFNHSGTKNVQGRVSGIVSAQSEADRSYLDAKFAAFEKALRERQENNIQPQDDPPVERVRRRR